MVMKENKAEHYVMIASTFLLALFVGVALFVTSIVRASPVPDAAASATYKAKCAMCHGPDGGGSPVGKSMNVPDLRSPTVQKLPDAQLAQIISDGKGGMPPFKSSLSEEQVHSMVAYVRSLSAKK
jgi:cytochrome c6